ncbi:MAG: hypothetical protein KGI29_01175, partial [Pseudomonadota bacterium]|nr:hypothetical protein [Pseudomonadota bacterium]
QAIKFLEKKLIPAINFISESTRNELFHAIAARRKRDPANSPLAVSPPVSSSPVTPSSTAALPTEAAPADPGIDQKTRPVAPPGHGRRIFPEELARMIEARGIPERPDNWLDALKGSGNPSITWTRD